MTGSQSVTEAEPVTSRTARQSVIRAANMSFWAASSWATPDSVLRSAACAATRASASRRCRNWVTWPPIASSRRSSPASGSRGVRETSTTTPAGAPPARSGSATVELQAVGDAPPRGGRSRPSSPMSALPQRHARHPGLARESVADLEGQPLAGGDEALEPGARRGPARRRGAAARRRPCATAPRRPSRARVPRISSRPEPASSMPSAAASSRITACSAAACWCERRSSVTSRMTPTKPVGSPSQPLIARTWTSAQRTAPATVRKRCEWRSAARSPLSSGANARACSERSSGCTNSHAGRPRQSSTAKPVASVHVSLRCVQRPLSSVSKTQSLMLSSTRRWRSSLRRRRPSASRNAVRSALTTTAPRRRPSAPMTGPPLSSSARRPSAVSTWTSTSRTCSPRSARSSGASCGPNGVPSGWRRPKCSDHSSGCRSSSISRAVEATAGGRRRRRRGRARRAARAPRTGTRAAPRACSCSPRSAPMSRNVSDGVRDLAALAERHHVDPEHELAADAGPLERAGLAGERVGHVRRAAPRRASARQRVGDRAADELLRRASRRAPARGPRTARSADRGRPAPRRARASGRRSCAHPALAGARHAPRSGATAARTASSATRQQSEQEGHAASSVSAARSASRVSANTHVERGELRPASRRSTARGRARAWP